MRIALLSAEYPPTPGGIGDYTRQLGVALAAHDFDVWVVTIASAQLQIFDLRGSQELARTIVQPVPLDWGWKSWPAVVAALDMLRPDLLHIQYQTGAYGMHPAINLLPWRLRGLPQRPRIAVTAHDLLEPYLFPKAGRLRRYLTRRLLCDADAAVVTNADDAAELAARHWFDAESRQAAQAHMIPIGSNIPVRLPDDYDRAAWRVALGVTAHEMLVAYFGLISRSKGLDTLLAALAQLPATFKLIVIGGAATLTQDQAYAAAMQAQIDELGLRARVTITGQVASEVVAAQMHAADLAALPFADGASFRRGSLLAALAHGLPVVTTDAEFRVKNSELRIKNSKFKTRNSKLTTAADGMLVDGEHVLLVPPGDANALAVAMARLAGDAELRAQLSAVGRALAAEFSWERIAQQHAALYRTLVTRRAS